MTAMLAMVSYVGNGKRKLSFEPPPGMTYEQWRQAGEQLSRVDVAVQWMIGDWWNAGEPYGSRVEDAKRIFPHLSHQTMRDYGWMADRFDVSRRRDTLAFEIHRETAALPEQEAEKLLDQAQDSALTRREMRIAVVKAKTRLGLHLPRDETDDDPDHTAARSIAHAWNRASDGGRQIAAELIIEAVGERDAAEARGDTAYLRNIDP